MLTCVQVYSSNFFRSTAPPSLSLFLSLYMCVYVCLYTCIFVHMRVYICAWVCVRMQAKKNGLTDLLHL